MVKLLAMPETTINLSEEGYVEITQNVQGEECTVYFPVEMTPRIVAELQALIRLSAVPKTQD